MSSESNARADNRALGSKSVLHTLETRLTAYRLFLNEAWNVLPVWLRTPEEEGRGLRDWFQTNWEMLVESPLQEALENEEGYVERTKRCLQVYGEGAACNPDGDPRIAYPGFDATHEVRVNRDDRFYAFGTVIDGSFVVAPPFDLVRSVDGQGRPRLLPSSAAAFSVVRTESFHALYVATGIAEQDSATPSTGTVTGLWQFLLLAGVPAVLAGGAAYFLGACFAENIPASAMGLFAVATYLIWGARETFAEILFNLLVYYLLGLAITALAPGPIGTVTAAQLLYAMVLGTAVSFVFFLVARLFLPAHDW